MMIREIISGGVRVLSGCHARWMAEPTTSPAIYFANHTSHLDALIIFASLPYPLRRRCRMVAAADYWMQGPIRRWLARDVFDVVPIERNPAVRVANPTAPLTMAIDAGHSLILFPEGGRQRGKEIAPFRAGLWHLAKQSPCVAIRPVWLENLNRIMPKGEILPLPLIAAATFGPPLPADVRAMEKVDFLVAARESLLALRDQQ